MTAGPMRPIMLTAALFAGSCSEEQSTPLNSDAPAAKPIHIPVPTSASGNQGSQRLHGMNEAERLVTFRDVVTSSRAQCAEVTSAERRRSLEDSDLWVIQCSDTGAWAVKVNPDSSTRPLSCSFLAGQGTPCESF